ncbi:MAG TPA: TMEM175 family protein [Gemmatimonadales bacterium]|jgi:uncharacterized membrane protein
MGKTRMEAFSDGVIAILITIMVLELKVPAGHDWPALHAVIPTLALYLLSFVLVGIYWNNHHHMLHAATRINGKILWANLHLLFWLSLVPFATTWMGDTGSAALPTAMYGVVLLCCALAFTLLQTLIIADEGPTSKLATAVQRDFKGKISIVFYLVAIPTAFVNHWIADACFVCVALLWLAPDPRIERVIAR